MHRRHPLPLRSAVAALAMWLAFLTPALASSAGVETATATYHLLGAPVLDSLAPGIDARRRVEVAAGLGGRHQLRLSTQAAHTLTFDPLAPSMRLFNARATWRYTMHEQANWAWRLGLTGALGSGDALGAAGFGSAPMLHLAGEASLARHWRLGFDADTLLSTRRFGFDLGVRVSYQLAPNLALVGGYRVDAGDGDEATGFTSSANVGVRLRF